MHIFTSRSVNANRVGLDRYRYRVSGDTSLGTTANTGLSVSARVISATNRSDTVVGGRVSHSMGRM
jgi:hypothetical protein